MKKAIVFGAVGFVVSLGGTTGVLVKTHHPPEVAVADSAKAKPDPLKADSSHKAPAKDSTHTDSARTEAPHHSDSASAHPDSVQPHVTPVAQPSPAPTTVHAAKVSVPVDPEAKAAAYKQVARVLSAMKPAEAVKVMALLSDDEVEGILRAVGPRQAADFLSNFPKERAASLSRRLLVPKGKEEGR